MRKEFKMDSSKGYGYTFDHIRKNLITELKASLLEATIQYEYYQNQYATTKDMGKQQAEEGLRVQKNRMDNLKRKIEQYRDFDLNKLEEWDV